MNKKNTYSKNVYLSACMFFIMIITFISTATIQKEYVFLEIKYQNNEFSLIDKSLEKGFYPSLEHDKYQAYKIEVVKDQSTLYQNSFDPTQLFSDAINDNDEMSGGVIKIDDVTFYLIVPSLTEGKAVQITKDNQVVFQETIYELGAQNCRIQ